MTSFLSVLVASRPESSDEHCSLAPIFQRTGRSRLFQAQTAGEFQYSLNDILAFRKQYRTRMRRMFFESRPPHLSNLRSTRGRTSPPDARIAANTNAQNDPTWHAASLYHRPSTRSFSPQDVAMVQRALPRS